MKITIKGTNLTLSDSVYAYIEDKIGSLEKFVQNVGEEGTARENPPVECWVEVEKLERPRKTEAIFRAEAQIKLPGARGIRAESSQWDLHQAIDEVKDDIQQQLKRYKGKILAKRRGKED